MAHKRLSAPRHYPINRKDKTWISSSQGSYREDYALPLVIVLRDVLNYADNEKEVKKVLKEGRVLVDGKKRRDKSYPVGFMDVLSLPDADKHYRIFIDNKGLSLRQTDDPERKWSKVTSKSKLKGGRTQLGLFNGSNVIVENEEASPGDTVEVKLPGKEIKNTIKLEKGSRAYIIKGRHVGEIKTIKDIKKSEIIFKEDGTSTVPDYVYPVNEELDLGEEGD